MGSKEEGKTFCGFTDDKPVVLFIGGSTGSQIINETLSACLDELLKDFNIIHLCGKGKLDESVGENPCYRQFEYISSELPDLMACTDLAISRSGANSVFEFLALRIPAIFIPLTLEQSRGDQILNAEYCEKKGYSAVLPQDTVTSESLLNKVNEVYDNRQKFISAMEQDKTLDGTARVLEVILKAAKK